MGRGGQKVTQRAAADAGAGARGKAAPMELTIDGTTYDITEFVRKHPGGSVIKFMAGEDASETFHAFHERSKVAQKFLKSLPSRPADKTKRDALVEDFVKLREEMRAEGVFDPSPVHIVYRIAEVLALFAGGAYALQSGWYWTGISSLALAQGRCGWLQHEAGHYSLTGNIKVDRIIQTVVYNVGTGMSAGWWRNQHNRHHAAPQKLQHDVDLETLPLVAFNSKIADRVKNPLGRLWLRLQALLFSGPITTLVAISWAFILHPQYVIRKRKYGELFAFFVRYAICAAIAATVGVAPFLKGYMLAYGLAATYIFVLFSVSHTHLDVLDADEHTDWVRSSLLYTTNVSPFFGVVSWIMGYLNFQIEHHLFPDAPQFRFPEVSKRVRALCDKHGLEYDVRPLTTCLWVTFKNLWVVGNGGNSHKKNE